MSTSLRLLCLCCCLCLIALPAQEQSFRSGELRLYTYEAQQEVLQDILDDQGLRHVSTLTWTWALRVLPSDTGGQVLRITFLHLRAEHAGPGYQALFDSARPAEQDPPLFAHLRSLIGQSINLERQADGQLRLGEHPNLAEAASPPGDQRRERAESLHSPAALSQLWQHILLQPGSQPPSRPDGLALDYQWDGSSYSLHLAEQPAAWQTRARGNTLEAQLDQLQGSGTLAIDAGGVLQQAEGSLAFRTTWQALGTPVQQQHQLRWQLVLQEQRRQE